MKKIVSRVLLAAVIAGVASLSVAADNWTGWVTDTACAAKGASASHADCAVKCVKDKGAKWALYNDADKSVWVLSDQDGAAKMAGKHVTVTGTADASAKSIKVASMAEAK